MGDNLGLIPL